MRFLLKPIQDAVGEVKALKNKDPKVSNHVTTVADGLNLFAWFLTVMFKYLV